MKNWLKTLLRILVALALYAAVWFGLRELSRYIITESTLVPPAPGGGTWRLGDWIVWVFESIDVVAACSLVCYFLYQILTSPILLGKLRASDLTQGRIVLINLLSIPVHLGAVWYIGYYLNGYGSKIIADWLSIIGLDRSYIYWLPTLVFTLLYWLLTRCLSHKCIFRYNKWKRPLRLLY